jgi:hypothetical protein
LASLFIGHAAQKSKLHNLQDDEGGNHMAETETETLFFRPGNHMTAIFVVYYCQHAKLNISTK